MTQHHPLPAISVRGNWDERAAQIDHIQERLGRIHRFGEHIVSGMAPVTVEVKKRSHHESPAFTSPTKAPN